MEREGESVSSEREWKGGVRRERESGIVGVEREKGRVSGERGECECEMGRV